MTGHLDGRDRSRLARLGADTLSVPEGLALLDQAVHTGEPLVVAARIDRGALRARDAQGTLPAVLRQLVPRGSRPVPAAGQDSTSAGLASQLAGMPASQRRQALADLVGKHTAAVLGHGSATALDADRGFVEMGFDSLTAVELRNRLAAAAGLRLPATLIFDCPTPAALARYLNERISPVSEIPDTANGDNGHRPLSDDEISAVDAMDVDELILAVHGHSANGHSANGHSVNGHSANGGPR
jgi:acyl carrier protein